MGLSLNFFRPTPHRVFHYENRYYDPKKEAMAERYAELEREKKGKSDDYVPGRIIRTKMRHNMYHNTKDSGKVFMNRVVILISILILIILAIYLTDGLSVLLTPVK